MRRWMFGAAVLAVLGVGPAVQARQVMGEAGSFRIVQAATGDTEKFMADWAKPSEPARLETQTSAKRGETLTTFIVFAGCKADAAGACQVSVDYKVLKPDGGVYAEPKGVEVYRDTAPPPNTFFLSVSGLGLRFEPQDPLGDYIVKAAVTDHVAGITVRTQQVLTATN